MAFDVVSVAAAILKDGGLKYVLTPPGYKADLTASGARLAPQRPEPRLVASARVATRPGHPSWRRDSRQAANYQVGRSPELEIRNAGMLEPELPPVWRELLERTPRSLAVWTYWNLGPDLVAGRCGQAAKDEESERLRRQRRGKVINLIFKKLAFPPGSHAFWPTRLAGADEAAPELFWAGARRIGARYVIIFGAKAAGALLPGQELKPLKVVAAQGATIIILKDIDRLENVDMPEVVALLRRILSPALPGR